MTDLTIDSVVRNDEVGGKSIATYKDGGGKHHQALVLVDPTGAPKGDASRPFYVTFAGIGLSGDVVCSQNYQALRTGFEGVFNNKLLSVELLNCGALTATNLKTCQGGAAEINIGSAANTKGAIKTKFELPYVSGVGCVVSFACELHNIASPISGHINRFGIGDTDHGIFVEWIGGSGKLYLKTYYNNTVGLNLESANWDVPVLYSGGTGLLKPDTIQRWTIRFDWITGRIILALDGNEVHDYNPASALADPITKFRNSKAVFQLTNTTAPGTTNYAKLYGIDVMMPSSSAVLNGLQVRSAITCGIPVAGGSPLVPLGLFFRPFRTVNGVTFKNNRVARIRSIKLSASPYAGAATDSLYPTQVIIYKNRQLTVPVSNAYDDTPLDPQLSWAGITAPIVATAQSDGANNAGYASGDTVKYKISALGAYGETQVNTTASASIGVGTPAKQVKVELVTPIANALAYGIYRQKNGAGNYVLIAYADPVTMLQSGFIDDGYLGDAGITAPGSSTAEQESFMYSYVSPTVNVCTGIEISGGVASVGDDAEYILDDGELLIYPGESVSVYVGAPTVTMIVNAMITWYED